MDYQQCRKCVVFLSDFGTVDGAVSAMHAVADDVDETLRLGTLHMKYLNSIFGEQAID